MKVFVSRTTKKPFREQKMKNKAYSTFIYRIRREVGNNGPHLALLKAIWCKLMSQGSPTLFLERYPAVGIRTSVTNLIKCINKLIIRFGCVRFRFGAEMYRTFFISFFYFNYRVAASPPWTVYWWTGLPAHGGCWSVWSAPRPPACHGSTGGKSSPN